MRPLEQTHFVEREARAATKSKAVTGFSGSRHTRGSIIPNGPALLICPFSRHLGMPPFTQPSIVTNLSSSFGHLHFLQAQESHIFQNLQLLHYF